MKAVLIVFALIFCTCIHIAINVETDSKTPLQGDFSFYSDETAFYDEIQHVEEQQWLEHLRKEADYIKLRDGQLIEGNTIGKNGYNRLLFIQPLLEDTIFKAHYDDIESFYFYEDSDFLTYKELK